MTLPIGTAAHPAPLTDEELAADWCFDLEPVPMSQIAAPADPVAILEEEVLRALQRPPCCVAFSGGLDSGCILAFAVDLARREGLPEPVPVTARFPLAEPDEREDEWQELVISQLAVTDWERFEVTNEFELVGEASERLSVRHGVLWPNTLYLLASVAERARGGSVLTGDFGDEVSYTPWHGALARDVLAGRRLPTPRALVETLKWAAPKPLRRALARRAEPARRWLCEPLRTAVDELLLGEQMRKPRRADHYKRMYLKTRATEIWVRNVAAVGAAAGVAMVHPMGRPELFAWSADRFGARGPHQRADVLVPWFGHCTPSALLARRGKAGYLSVFWGPDCRRFAETWNPEWWPSQIVDPEALKQEWRRVGLASGTWNLFQLAWWSSKFHRGSPPDNLGEIARARHERSS